MVMAGTPQKMLDYLLETRVGCGSVSARETIHDPCLDDFLLTHIVFMPTRQLVTELARQYPFIHHFQYIQPHVCVFYSVKNYFNLY